MNDLPFTAFVGIAVSKQTLDWTLLIEGKVRLQKQTANTAAAIEQLLCELAAVHPLTRMLFCLEHTGIYQTFLLQTLHAHACPIWLESALRINHSMGIVRGKSDPTDAVRIARYAHKHHPDARLWKPQSQTLQRLSHLAALRERLLQSQTALRTAFDEQQPYLGKSLNAELEKHSRRTLSALDKDLQDIEAKIKKVIGEDDHLRELFDNLTSIPGVGPVTATEMILATKEFTAFDTPEQFACYSGVAPFPHQSGTSLRGRKRVSPKANKSIKTRLHLAAMSAIRLKGKIRDFYLRKLSEGKSKMCALNAVRNKLIHLMFALARKNQKYDSSYA